MNANHLKKRLKLPLDQALHFHLLVELTFIRHEPLIASDLALLTLLLQTGQQSLPAFCEAAAHYLHPNCPPGQLATRAQNVRNRLVKLEKRGLVLKSRPGAKTLVEIHDSLQLPLDKPLLFDYQLLCLEPAQTTTAT